MKSPRCIVIAGSNGARKTTFAREYLPKEAAGYRIEMIFLRLSLTQLAVRRIAARVRQGGHNVPRADVLRRFIRGWENFQSSYSKLADSWEVYDNSRHKPELLEIGP